MDSIFHFSPQENLTLLEAFIFVSSMASAILFLFSSTLINKKLALSILSILYYCHKPNFLCTAQHKIYGLETLANNLKTTDGSPPSIDLNTIAIIPLLLVSV
jgi:hypothetical protein